MYFVYILKSLFYQKGYVGSTDNLNRRLKEHNNGKSLFSRRYKPWQIVFFEEYQTVKEAKQREKYLKSASGRRFLKELFKNL